MLVLVLLVVVLRLRLMLLDGIRTRVVIVTVQVLIILEVLFAIAIVLGLTRGAVTVVRATVLRQVVGSRESLVAMVADVRAFLGVCSDVSVRNLVSKLFFVLLCAYKKAGFVFFVPLEMF